jgi:hypothetical protein
MYISTKPAHIAANPDAATILLAETTPPTTPPPPASAIIIPIIIITSRIRPRIIPLPPANSIIFVQHKNHPFNLSAMIAPMAITEPTHTTARPTTGMSLLPEKAPPISISHPATARKTLIFNITSRIRPCIIHTAGNFNYFCATKKAAMTTALHRRPHCPRAKLNRGGVKAESRQVRGRRRTSAAPYDRPHTP